MRGLFISGLHLKDPIEVSELEQPSEAPRRVDEDTRGRSPHKSIKVTPAQSIRMSPGAFANCISSSGAVARSSSPDKTIWLALTATGEGGSKESTWLYQLYQCRPPG
jgi:hypothetical protein